MLQLSFINSTRHVCILYFVCELVSFQVDFVFRLSKLPWRTFGLFSPPLPEFATFIYPGITRISRPVRVELAPGPGDGFISQGT